MHVMLDLNYQQMVKHVKWSVAYKIAKLVSLVVSVTIVKVGILPPTEEPPVPSIAEYSIAPLAIAPLLAPTVTPPILSPIPPAYSLALQASISTPHPLHANHAPPPMPTAKPVPFRPHPLWSAPNAKTYTSLPPQAAVFRVVVR